MEYEDTNILRTQYVDDLVEQRQVMEDTLRYQEMPVNEGEGMDSMMLKAEAITGVHPEIKYISYCYVKRVSREDIKQIDIVGWKSVRNMFRNCYFEKSNDYLDLSHFDWSAVEDASYFMRNANVLRDNTKPGSGNIGVPFYLGKNVDWGKLVNMDNMFDFSGVSGLSGLLQGLDDLNTISVPNLEELNDPFSGYFYFNYNSGYDSAKKCNWMLLTKMVDARPKNISRLITTSDSYRNNSMPATVYLLDCIKNMTNTWDFSRIVSLKNIFVGGLHAHSTDYVDFLQEIYNNISKWNIDSAEDLTGLFCGGASNGLQVEVNLASRVFDKLKAVTYMFQNAQITYIHAGYAPNPTITSLNYTFAQRTAANDSTPESVINLSGWNLGAVTNVSYAFNYRDKLKHLSFGYDLGKGYTSKSNNSSSYKLTLGSPILAPGDVIDLFRKLYDLNLTYGVYDEEGNPGTGKLYTQTVDLHADVITQLTPEDIAIATNKGWTVS